MVSEESDSDDYMPMGLDGAEGSFIYLVKTCLDNRKTS